jgi:hypothetical protein
MDAYRIEDCIARASIGMTRGNVVRVADGSGIEVSVAYGSIWLTQENGTDDVCLGAGESFRIARDGKTIVTAMKPSLVTLTPPAAQAHALHVSMARAGTGESIELFDMNERRTSGGFDAWLDKYWVRLFVPSSRPTTAAL